MRAAIARLRPVLAEAAGKAADLAGGALRQVGRGAPGIAGPLAIAWGCHEIYSPLGWIVAGVFLLMLDRRVP